MRGKKAILGILLGIVLTCSTGVPLLGKNEALGSLTLRRYAFIVGSNEGGGVRIPLRYAASDAQAFAQVMMNMGGLNSSDTTILLNPNYSEFSQGMKDMRDMMQTGTKERREFILYYSGHSDETGLLLGSYRYSYEELRDDITNIPADVHIVILDSCSSGALTRSKGGVRKPAFLLDASNVTEGHAFLTSSSADEAAQESDRIGASFFTHYLVSGLRGAADATGDGKVTLNEAYHYAFNETLASTEKTRYGAQHPTYDISLTGTGDIILTDLRETSAGLVVAQDINGRLFVRDYFGSLVVELNKPYDNQIDLGLEPGVYEVTLDSPKGTYQAYVNVTRDKRTLLTHSDLVMVETEATTPRGEDAASRTALQVTEEKNYVRQFVRLGVVPSIVYPSSEELYTVNHLSLNLLWGDAYRIEGLELGLIGNVAQEDLRGAQIAGVSNIVRGEVVGAQVAGFYNQTAGELRGAQFSTIMNRIDSHAYGAQITGIGNQTRGDVIGLQLTGVLGITEGSVIGAQVSGITNIADHVGGAQIGLVNFGYSIRGAQIGLINIARDVTGTQVGVVNISDEVEGESVGLVTYSREGRRHFEIWGDSTGFAHAGFRMGTSHVYTLFTAAYNPTSNPKRISYGLGLGGEIPLDWVFINLDAAINDHHTVNGSWYPAEGPSFIPEVRALFGILPARRFGIYFGGSVQFFIPGWYSESTMAGYVADDASPDQFSTKWAILAGMRF
jgi:hypothetical protein